MKITEVLSDESKWARNTLARDKYLAAVDPTDALAVCWCLDGAIDKCYSTFEDRAKVCKIARQAIDTKYPSLINQGHTDFGAIAIFNDSTETKFQDVFEIAKITDEQLGKENEKCLEGNV